MTNTKEPSMTKQTSSVPRASAAVVRDFFTAFGRGDVEAVVAAFHPEARLTAVHAGPPAGVYGSYVGQEGARAFVAALGRTFDTKAFAVNEVVGEGAVVYASGHFIHQLKATGRTFSSEWALRCQVDGGVITRYHFFEDSAAYAEAAR
jgi:ketosteroid isomerase-like protein